MGEDQFREIIFDKVLGIARSGCVFGKPVPVDEMTLIPLLEISFGAFAAGQEGTAPEGMEGDGDVAATGARISAQAILVIKKESITVVSDEDMAHYKVLLRTSLDRF